jgi:ubiquinone biosynthesis protein
LSLRSALRLGNIIAVTTRHRLDLLVDWHKLPGPASWLLRLSPLRLLPAPNTPRGVRIREALQDLGPVHIKFGQMLSTRVDLMPMAVAMELKKLQDEVPPGPFEQVRGVLERSFKRPLLGKEGLFAEFDKQSVAAASIAQVHFARLHDGRKVAVKVRRPNIERTIEADLAILKLLASLFERYFPEYRRLKAPQVVHEFANTIRGELNLRAEAAHAGRFAENFAGLEGVRVPDVLWDYTRAEVLTTERIAGIPIDERARLVAAGHDCLKLCERTAALFFHMVFVDGYFHADMHPGNIFVADNGDIILVDFGIVGRLDMRSRLYLAEMLLAFLKADYRRSAEVHVEAGYVPADTNVSAFEDALREIAVPIFNRPLGEISIAELLMCMFAVTERFQMETQPQLLLLQKTMVVIEGVARELADQTNIWVLAKPLVSDWVARHMGPIGKAEAMATEMKGQLLGWMTLPERVDRLIEGVEMHKTVLAAEPSRLPSLIGVVLAAAGGGLLAAYGASIAGIWAMLAGGAGVGFGLVLAVSRR